MDKNLPPPYSEACAPNVGFNVPLNQPRPQNFQPQIPTQQVYPGQPTYAPPGTTVLLTSVPASVFGPHPQPVTCPFCQHQSSTRIISEPSTKTHLLAALLCFFGCIPCCLLPYCMDTCQNRNHYCSHCSAYLGTYFDDVPYQRRSY